MRRSRILIIGSGAREHALAWKLRRSVYVGDIFCVPGNGGIRQDAVVPDIGTEPEILASFARSEKIDMVLVGPEAPLVGGLADYLIKGGITVFGPVAGGAILEGSKIFAKQFMARYGIPTAEYRIFDNKEAACGYLSSMSGAVIKADGLCAGKGVYITDNYDDSCRAVTEIMKERKFGEAGRRILIEEKLQGEEISVLALVSGSRYSLLLPSQDHKRAFDGDRGPNTGGMGAYAPASVMDSAMMENVENKIIKPVVEGLASDGIEYFGVLYAGLMIQDGKPYVLEFNVRFGDPETEAVLPLMKSDLFKCIMDIKEGGVPEISWFPGACVDVVMASQGYPGDYDKGSLIAVDEERIPAGVELFHSGTKSRDGRLYTAGGRVVNIAAVGENILDAQKKAYQAVEAVDFEGAHYRTDIGYREIERYNNTENSV